MSRNVLIFGTHSLRGSLLQQYERAGTQVGLFDTYTVDPFTATLPDEMVILPLSGADDSVAEAFVEECARTLRGRLTQRPLVHLLLSDASTLRKLQVSDFPDEVNEVLSVYPFTMEDAWAETILKGGLERTPVLATTRQFVHLVIFGFDEYAKSIAIYAAETAHYPNYNGKDACPYRTRITVIAPDLAPERDRFIARYHHLFDQSFYRLVDLQRERSTLHHPQYEGKREDFVDIEWEFVEGDLSHPVVVDKLAYWAGDERQQLSLVLSTADDGRNLDAALALPEALLEKGTPVWVRMHRDGISSSLAKSPRYGSVKAFGMDDDGYDVSATALRTARLLHYVYSCGGDVPAAFDREAVEAAWQKAGSLKMRLSNIWSARCIPVKMRSLGFDPADLHALYALSAEETMVLARTEHSRWCVERLLSGTRVCTDAEREAIKKDISLKNVYKKQRDAHFDLCAFDELQTDAAGVDVRSYDYVPLISLAIVKEDML